MSTRRLRPFRSRTIFPGAEAPFVRSALPAPLRAASAARWPWRGSAQPGVTQVNIMSAVPFLRLLEDSEMLRDQSLVIAHLAGAAAERDAAGVEDHHLVGEVEGELDVLLDQENRLAFLLQSRDGAAHFGDDQGREAFGGLVHQQHARISHERPPDREHLLLASGKRARQLLQPLFQPWKQLDHALQVPRDRHARPLLPRDGEILAHREGGKNPPALGHEADALSRDRLGREPSDRLPEQADLAAARRQEADNGAHAGRLAGAVAPQQRQYPPGVQRERYVVQYVALAVERIDPIK